jgi:addiction module HigA family antidote|tara:strand:+ start:51 stop:353 length:303 start_codon:yes stop_codon:yes gene_type:complete
MDIFRDRTRPPAHPGAILRHDVLPALGMKPAQFARHIGVSRQLLNKIIRENDPAPLSPEMAIRIGQACGNGPILWLNMQRNYDLWHAAKKVDIKSIEVAA